MIGSHVFWHPQQPQIQYPEVNTDIEWDHLKRETLFQDQRIRIDMIAAAHYPYIFQETERYVFLYEGLIYNRTDQEVMQWLSETQDANEQRSFIDHCDGEFLLHRYDKQLGSYVLFNDSQGHMPYYYMRADFGWVLGRCVRYLLPMQNQVQINKQALYEFLCLEWIQEDKSLFEGIELIKPAHRLTIDAQAFIEFEDVSIMVIDQRHETAMEATVLAMCKILDKGMSDRLRTLERRGYQIGASLSGGFDSRMIAALFSHKDYPCHYVTYRHICDESGVAKAVFDRLELKGTYHHLDFDPPKAQADNTGRLMYLTDARVNRDTTAFCLKEAQTIFSDFAAKADGSWALFGGFPGGYFRLRYPYLRAFEWSNPHRLISETVQNSKVLKVKEKGISDETLMRRRFPEKMRRLGLQGGEDRDRIYRWTVHPFAAWPLQRYAKQFVQLDSKRYVLFTQMIAHFDARALDIPIYGRSVNLKQPKELLELGKREEYWCMRTKQWLKFKLQACPKLYVHLANKTDRDRLSELRIELEQLFAQSPSLSKLLNKEKAMEYMPLFEPYNRLLSVAHYIAYLEKELSISIKHGS